ncbi:CBS domain-containing protein [Mizugakiibacter sediminis]|uniref:Histidine kinase n=2 Tax=Mizugakiibacter sediminis TaxID=1475481 RepID=A0A0S6YXP8_9GAMM|nr:CBS domain-containing protein [Mizugakiibacter sediminis]
MRVGELCNREVVFVRSDETARAAAEVMREFHVGDVVVVVERNGRNMPAGVVTDRDLAIEVVAKGVDPDAITAGDMITQRVVCAELEESYADVLDRMRRAGVRRMPVVDVHGALVGILALDDVLRFVSQQLAEIAQLITVQPQREAMVRA